MPTGNLKRPLHTDLKYKMAANPERAFAEDFRRYVLGIEKALQETSYALGRLRGEEKNWELLNNLVTEQKSSMAYQIMALQKSLKDLKRQARSGYKRKDAFVEAMAIEYRADRRHSLEVKL